MIFYKEVDIPEHLLYVREILELYPIFSDTGKEHRAAMNAMLDSLSEDKYYYNSRNGLKRAYSRTVYLTAINAFEEAFTGGISCIITIKNKKYKIFKIGLNIK